MVTKIRLMRIKQGLTIRDISRQIGIHETMLSAFENGRIVLPPKWGKSLSEALQVPQDEIIDRKGFPTIMNETEISEVSKTEIILGEEI